MWVCYVIGYVELYSVKPELRFYVGSNPAQGVRDSWWWGFLKVVPAENKAECLLPVNHTTKIIHHRTFTSSNIHHQIIVFSVFSCWWKALGVSIESLIIRAGFLPMELDRRKEIQSVKSAWSSLIQVLIKDHVLPTPLGNNLGRTIICTRKGLNLPNSCVPIITHPYPCCLFMCVMCY